MSDVKRVWAAGELKNELTISGEYPSARAQELAEYLAKCTRLYAVWERYNTDPDYEYYCLGEDLRAAIDEEGDK